MKPSSSPYPIVIPTPFGAVGVRIKNELVTEIALIPQPLAQQLGNTPLAIKVQAAIHAYLQNPQTSPDFVYQLAGTPYQQKVWQAIAGIPCGKTLNYSELAAKVDSGPRAVANACGANRLLLLIPCHRVVAKHGLGGFMQGHDGGLKIKQWLLAHESK